MADRTHIQWAALPDEEGQLMQGATLNVALSREMNCKDLKGGNPDEWPEDIRVREFPQPERLLTYA